MNPLSAVHLLAHQDELGPRFAALGSCFAFRRRTHILTAAHCIGETSIDKLSVISDQGEQRLTRRAQSVDKHPVADLALITLAEHEADVGEPFWGAVANWSLAEDFLAYGYPEDIFGEDARVPVQRIFKGSFQRFLQYKSRLGFEYVAGEMSIGCPGGLSGGPLFRPAAPVMLLGLVTENHESTTFLHSEEVEEKGQVTRVRNQNVINYGMCLMLSAVGEWIDARVPPREVVPPAT